MYLRSTPRRNKDGSEVRYLQLAHNTWDPGKRRSTVQVVYNFGREDPENREALQRLVASITRFLAPDAALAASADGLAFTESRPLGGAWALDALWSRLGIGREMKRLLKGRRRDAAAERVLFELTANRALAPSSKLAASRWTSQDAKIHVIDRGQRHIQPADPTHLGRELVPLHPATTAGRDLGAEHVNVKRFRDPDLAQHRYVPAPVVHKLRTHTPSHTD
jgi:hypothetical protein